jgi:hypothetical protein
MATKKSSPGKSVAVSTGRAVALPSWRERAAKSINSSKAAVARLPQATGNFLSFRGGVITLNGQNLGNQLPLVLLAYTGERSYYAQAFQPDVAASPDCYSYDGIAPHAEASIAQSDACANCRFNEFGSAENQKGKACKEGAKLAFIHADALKSPDSVLAAQIYQARLSVLNAKGFRSYVENNFSTDDGGPSWAVISNLECRPDSKSQYAVSFMATLLDGDDALLDAIASRVDEAEKLLAVPYPVLEQRPAPAPRGRAAPAKAPMVASRNQPARKRNF